MATVLISADASVRTTRDLRRISLVAVAAFFGVYVLLVLTPFGQTLDDSIYLGRVDAAERAWAKSLLNSITIASVAVLLAVAFGIALVRRRPLAGLAAVGATGATIVTAEILKMIVPRPDLTPLDDQIGPTTPCRAVM
jgi:ABC-type Fe3+ transport system permease subunit